MAHVVGLSWFVSGTMFTSCETLAAQKRWQQHKIYFSELSDILLSAHICAYNFFQLTKQHHRNACLLTSLLNLSINPSIDPFISVSLFIFQHIYLSAWMRRLGVRVPLMSRHFLSQKLWHFYKNNRSCVENECCCPRTVNISNINFT